MLLTSYEVTELFSRSVLRDHLANLFIDISFGFRCEGILGILAQRQDELVKGESAGIA